MSQQKETLTIDQFKELLQLAKVARGYHNKTQKFINITSKKFGAKIADIFTDVVCSENVSSNEALQKMLKTYGIDVI